MTTQSLTEQVGGELGVTAWQKISQRKIDPFAEASGDMQWIHVHPERAAAESSYKANIAHGFLMLSMLSQTSREVLAATMQREESVKPVALPSGYCVTTGFKTPRF